MLYFYLGKAPQTLGGFYLGETPPQGLWCFSFVHVKHHKPWGQFYVSESPTQGLWCFTFAQVKHHKPWGEFYLGEAPPQGLLGMVWFAQDARMQRNLHPGMDFLHPNSQDAEPGCMLAKLSFVRQVVCFSDPKWGPSWSLLTRLYVSLV